MQSNNRNAVLSMLCNVTPQIGLLSFTIQIYITGKILNNQAMCLCVSEQVLSSYLNKHKFKLKTSFLIKWKPLSTTRVSPNFKVHQLCWCITKILQNL